MRLIPLYLTSFALFGSVGATQLAAEDAAGGGMHVEVRGGLLSVDIGKGVPLSEVLRTISDKTGFRLSTRGSLGDVRPQAFTNITVERGIERLVGDHSLLMIHDRSARRLAEVRVYEVSQWEQTATEPQPKPTVFLFPLLMPE